ncbi:claudin domain-containing protein 2-like [Mytilus trossulus]|uniref:claudin domain-containing protein 2-like n=1 Tax=Mytilus trossulus TaxID=6551 RepID=UPI003003A8EC
MKMPVTLAEIPPMLIGGNILSAISLILHIIGFSTTYWFRFETVHIGLWKYCAEDKHFIKGAEYCLDLIDVPGYSNQLIAAQVLECLALVAFVAAVTCVFLKIFVLKEQVMLLVVTGLLNWLAGGLSLVGVIVYATMSFGGSKLGYSHFHYSFGLCIVGGIGAVFSGIVFFLAWRWVRN